MCILVGCFTLAEILSVTLRLNQFNETEL